MAVVDELVTVLGTKLSPTALSGLSKYGKAVDGIKTSVLKADKALAAVRQRVMPLAAMFTAGAAAGGVLVKSVVDQVSALDGLDEKLAKTRSAERAKKALKEIVTKDDIKRVRAYREGVEGLTLTMRGMVTRIVLDALPALQGLVEKGDKWLKQNKEMIQQGAGEFFKGLAAGFESFAQGVGKVVKLFDPFITKIKEMVPELKGWEVVAGLVRGTLFALAIVFAPLLVQFTLLAAAIGLAAVAFDDLFGYLNGEDSLIGQFLKSFSEEFPGATKALKEMGTEIGSVFTHLQETISDLVGQVQNFFKTFDEKFPNLTGNLEKVKEAFTDVFGPIVKGMIEGIVTVLKVAIDMVASFLESVGFLMGKVFEFYNWLANTQDPTGKFEESKEKGYLGPYADNTQRSIAVQEGREQQTTAKPKLLTDDQFKAAMEAVRNGGKTDAMDILTGGQPKTMSVPITGASGGATIDESQTNSNNKLTDSRTFNNYITAADPNGVAAAINSQGNSNSILLQNQPGANAQGVS